jgi:hypothetical protein
VPFDGKGWAIGSGTVIEIEMLINDHYFYFYECLLMSICNKRLSNMHTSD